MLKQQGSGPLKLRDECVAEFSVGFAGVEESAFDQLLLCFGR